MALGTFSQRLMNVSLATIIRKLRQRGLLAKTLGDKLLDRIPEIALSEIVGRPMVRIDGPHSYVDGSLPLCDLLALLSVLVSRAPQTVLEIGTFNGYTTRLMALNLPDAEIHTIDLPENFIDSGAGMPKDDWHLISARRVGSEYRADPSITSVKQHFGDTAEYVFPTAEIFFIDGSHTYAYVRNDTEKALKSSATKALIWHDCDRNHPGVTRWLVEMIQTGYPVRHIEGTSLAILELQNHA
jgi:methyltransferase family protein